MANTMVIKRLLSTSQKLNVTSNVTVIGGGLMGAGIAQVAAQAGQNVTLVDVNSDVLKKSEERITSSLMRVAKKLHKTNSSDVEAYVNRARSRLSTSTDPVEAVKRSDLVIEAIVENLDVKRKLFKDLDVAAPSHTLFASNTSSLSIKDIAQDVKRKDKFGGLHFFNPVPVMKLLEVIKTDETSPETVKAFEEWGKSIGKVTVICKDTLGFIVNRLLVPYMSEAVRMYERGDASFQDIDTAMKLGAGYPMGPFELSDFTGHDTGLYIQQIFHKKFPNDPLFKPIATVKKMVDEGKLGVKSGEGFYKYNK
ncbi:probable 3-hydroxyacyl-CoA dehydrogenase B0272.3 [Agrilus planipennis]|uniref:3-hydroxyacyl-CoA dehydrogenase n=1 Tax=Agrilus planipennis TaxID=224129 RepID=A0A1W4WGI0_AGRPL|nr:probable 3-hydroxyacyl-CoA dehydrogenase B0272.3 [Agrilus planipennis]